MQNVQSSAPLFNDIENGFYCCEKPDTPIKKSPVLEIQNIANEYIRDNIPSNERVSIKNIEYACELDWDGMREVGEYYVNNSELNSQEVVDSYEALEKELSDQFQLLLDKGYRFTIVDGNPYPNSIKMRKDVRDNKHLYVQKTETSRGYDDLSESDSVLMKKTLFKDGNGNVFTVNDVLRAVHDVFGHCKAGSGFGAIGEELAWLEHMQMFSPNARKAMATETRANNGFSYHIGKNDKSSKLFEHAQNLRRHNLTTEALRASRLGADRHNFAEPKSMVIPDRLQGIDFYKK